ncbi:MAG: hypothetical protein KDK36_14660, partial [Leptospiraceae bacterium]|nr:hypothetical protein [Leptospiraceae bacterium]
DSGDLKKETIQKNKPKVTRSLKVGNYLPPYKNNYQLTVEYFYVTKDFNICSIFFVPWLEKWFKKSLIVDLEGNL